MHSLPEAAEDCEKADGEVRIVKAIISDIHSNLEALTAVLADIATQNVTEIYCLGDIVGYGPNPRECVDLSMQCRVVLLGNHDQGAMFDPEGFNPQAERAIFWTRAQLEAPIENRNKMAQRWEFLAERPKNPQGKWPTLRPRLRTQSDQRICLPGRYLQSAQDGPHFCASR